MLQRLLFLHNMCFQTRLAVHENDRFSVFIVAAFGWGRHCLSGSLTLFLVGRGKNVFGPLIGCSQSQTDLATDLSMVFKFKFVHNGHI